MKKILKERILIFIHLFNERMGNITDGKLDCFRGYRRYPFVTFIIAIIIVILFLIVLIIHSNDKKDIGYDKVKNYKLLNDGVKYVNEHNPMPDYKECIYIGGEVLKSNKSGIVRWVPLYYDTNGNEILKSSNTLNYISAGMPLIGTDRVEVDEKYRTVLGFRELVLNWTGSILFDNNRKGVYDNLYGHSINQQEYNKPLDIIADKNWNNKKKLRNNEIYEISTVSSMSLYSIGGNISESVGYLTEKEYLLCLLRNAFGYISDSFYDLSNDKLEFPVFSLQNVEFGDIGIYIDEKKQFKPGICIGFDEKKNPVFSLCSNAANDSETKKIMSNINKNTKKDKIDGYNYLHIEKISNNSFISLLDRNKFSIYCKTNLPFVDKRTDRTANNKSLLLTSENIYKYNSQIMYINDNNDISENFIINSRVKRILYREEIAKKNREKYNIDKNEFNKIDIDNINTTFNSAYTLPANFENKRDNKLFIETYDIFEKDYDDICNLSINEIIEYYLDKGAVYRDEWIEVLQIWYEDKKNIY